MPGHKLGKGVPSALLDSLYLLDLTEIPGLDNLYYPSGVIEEAQQLAAKAFGADRTFFLVNGSTCGIQAAVMTICKPGDKLMIARDCHRSAVAGMMLAGVVPIYVKPKFDRYFGIPTVVSPEDIESALRQNPEVVGVYITRPNYYGVCSDIKAISELVHSYNKVLIIDEAHGAHLKFSKRLPASSLEYGADICVQSAHKTLPAFTQGAYLHIKGSRIDIEKLKFNLSLLGTSSPSYIIMAFLDIARAVMEEKGERDIDRLLERIDMLDKDIGTSGFFRVLCPDDINGACIDRTRVVINVRNTGRTGFEIEKILRNQYNIQVEMADLYNVVCITTIADTDEDLGKLREVIGQLAASFDNATALEDIYMEDLHIPEQRVEPGRIMHMGFVRKKLADAVGRVSRAMITPYPPGIPVICPGEVISEHTVGYIGRIIEAGGIVNGVSANLEVELVE